MFGVTTGITVATYTATPLLTPATLRGAQPYADQAAQTGHGQLRGSRRGDHARGRLLKVTASSPIVDEKFVPAPSLRACLSPDFPMFAPPSERRPRWPPAWARVAIADHGHRGIPARRARRGCAVKPTVSCVRCTGGGDAPRGTIIESDRVVRGRRREAESVDDDASGRLRPGWPCSR